MALTKPAPTPPRSYAEQRLAETAAEHRAARIGRARPAYLSPQLCQRWARRARWRIYHHHQRPMPALRSTVPDADWAPLDFLLAESYLLVLLHGDRQAHAQAQRVAGRG